MYHSALLSSSLLCFVLFYRNSLPYWDLPTTETWAISEPLMYRSSLPYRDLPTTETWAISQPLIYYRNSVSYRDLPTTETWAFSDPLMYHGTFFMHYGTMSWAARLRNQSSLGMIRCYGILEFHSILTQLSNLPFSENQRNDERAASRWTDVRREVRRRRRDSASCWKGAVGAETVERTRRHR